MSNANANAPVPFTQFLQSVTDARYSDYAHQPTTKVQNAQGFEEMRLYILTLYAGAHAAKTYMVNQQTFDCIAASSKQSTPPIAASAKSTNSTTDQSGIANVASCKEGTIPMERITLDQIVQFPTLQAFLAKSPGGSSLPPVPPPGKK